VNPEDSKTVKVFKEFFEDNNEVVLKQQAQGST